MARHLSCSEREQARVARIFEGVSDGVFVGSRSRSLLFDRFFAEGVLNAFRLLNLTEDAHSLTVEAAWEWCCLKSPDNHDRVWAGLGFLGQGCHDFLSCGGCKFFADCQSRDDPRNRPEECGE